SQMLPGCAGGSQTNWPPDPPAPVAGPTAFVEEEWPLVLVLALPAAPAPPWPVDMEPLVESEAPSSELEQAPPKISANSAVHAASRPRSSPRKHAMGPSFGANRGAAALRNSLRQHPGPNLR